MITEAILKINPNAKVSVRGTDLDTCEIVWLENTRPISKTDIQTKITELENEYTNNAYQRNRAKEYPSIVDQLDDIYHNGVAGWKKTIKAIKDKYPKE